MMAAAPILVALCASQPATAWRVEELLRQHGGFDDRQVEAVLGGAPAGRALGGGQRIVLTGAIRLPVSRGVFLDWYRDPRNWTLTTDGKRPAIEQAARFGDPPRPSDMAGSQVAAADLAGWISSAASYQPHGDSPCSAATAETLRYWTRERYGFGLKPNVALYHAEVCVADAATTTIVTRQIRAARYFKHSIAVTLLAENPDGTATLIYRNDSQIDVPAGFRALVRAIVRRSAPSAARRELESLRRRVADWAAQ